MSEHLTPLRRRVLRQLTHGAATRQAIARKLSVRVPSVAMAALVDAGLIRIARVDIGVASYALTEQGYEVAERVG